MTTAETLGRRLHAIFCEVSASDSYTPPPWASLRKAMRTNYVKVAQRLIDDPPPELLGQPVIREPAGAR